MTDEQTIAAIGDNQSPLTPFEKLRHEIADLYMEAKNWLDGAAIETRGQADSLSTLINLIRDSRKRADEARKIENKPFDDGKAEVQARYNAIFKNCDIATDTCKRALEPWLKKEAAAKEVAAAEARRIADEQTKAAQEAIRAANLDNLAEREAAEEKLKTAKRAETEAKRAERDTARAGIGVGRATSLRSVWKAHMDDPHMAASHYWATNRPAFEDYLQSLADADVRAGKREIPGFIVSETKVAV